MTDFFKKASQIGLTFETIKGPLQVSDLWRLPLTTTSKTALSLDNILVQLNKSLSEEQVVSFVDAVKKETTSLNKLRFDIACEILKDRQQAAKENQQKVSEDSKKQMIRELLAEKKLESLKSLSEEELEKLLEN